MVESLVPYFTGGTILFFFWAYGVVSFVLDLQNKIIPAISSYWENRQREKEKQEEEKQRKEREKQLY